MHRKTITLTEQMQEWVSAQIKSGRYGNDSEYFRDLVRHDQEKAQAADELRQMMSEARASGFSSRTPQQIIQDIKARHQADE